jgi:hypothetical protein
MRRNRLHLKSQKAGKSGAKRMREASFFFKPANKNGLARVKMHGNMSHAFAGPGGVFAL